MGEAGDPDVAAVSRWNRDRLSDLAFAVVIAAAAVVSVFATDSGAWLVLPILVASLPLALRRRWPFSVLLVSSGASFFTAALGWDSSITSLCSAFALYTVAAWGPRRAVVAGVLVMLGGEAGLALIGAPFFDSPLAWFGVVCHTVPWLFGLYMRRRRAARDRAVADAAEAERLRGAAAERAVIAERLRIAQELHDVVAHTLSAIAVQSATARHDLAQSPRQAATALSSIETASRDALSDLRRMLGVLRTGPLADQPEVEEVSRALVSGGAVRRAVADAVLAGALAVLVIAGEFVFGAADTHVYREPTAWSIVLGLLSCLPLAVRGRRPFLVFILTMSAASTLAALGWNSDWALFCTIIALYTVALQRTWPVIAASLLFGYSAIVVLAVLDTPNFTTAADIIGQPLELLAVALGRVVRRQRRDHLGAVERLLEAERTRAVLAERAVVAERLRIARELHDVVSHTLTVIAVQSGVARHQLTEHPEVAGPALAAIEEAGRSGLEDLRRMLDVLHDAADTDASLAPSPGLAELELLVSAHRAAYGAIELTVDPAVESASASLQVTAFRLVQEALTNVRKHAPGAAAHVSVAVVDGQVVVQIDDDGTRQPIRTGSAAGGYGLTGMRERTALFDGTLEAGPRHGGGFRVRAVLRPLAQTSGVVA